MKINAIEFLDNLKKRVEMGSAEVSLFKEIDSVKLSQKNNIDSWSVLECIAHLNLYYAFYIPLIKVVLENQKEQKGLFVFKTGILGQFFVKLMEPKKGKIIKMKAVQEMKPQSLDLRLEELKLFIHYQQEFLSLLERSKNYDLNSCQVPTIMSRWITINLGDTFRFIVAHNERHLRQAKKCLKNKFVENYF